MADKIIVSKSKVTNLFDSIRAKSGSTDLMSFDVAKSTVDDIQTPGVTVDGTTIKVDTDSYERIEVGQVGDDETGTVLIVGGFVNVELADEDSSVTVENLEPANIKKGVTILGVTGELEPSGELEITENGTYDVKSKASVIVNVPSITAEQWDGSYEEISSGFTLTLDVPAGMGIANSSTYTYSLDNGATYNKFTSGTMVLEKATQIKFKMSFSSYNWYIKTSEGDTIASILGGGESENIPVTSDTTWYLTITGGGAD